MHAALHADQHPKKWKGQIRTGSDRGNRVAAGKEQASCSTTCTALSQYLACGTSDAHSFVVCMGKLQAAPQVK